jgi:hypothetical protein
MKKDDSGHQDEPAESGTAYPYFEDHTATHGIAVGIPKQPLVQCLLEEYQILVLGTL